MPRLIGPLSSIGFGTEVIYSFVIIVCSLMVYFGTKELYELSSYKGIKYFRKAFLFFAIAYFFRSFIKFILVYFNIRELWEFSPKFFSPITLFFFIYLSSMAVFYLLYSFMYKKWGKSKIIVYSFHIIALVISFIHISSRNPKIYLLINLILLVFIIIIVPIYHKKSKQKTHNLYAIYLLLFIFWILNIIDILIPKFLGNVQLFIYLASSGIFLTILYKVIKKTGPN